MHTLRLTFEYDDGHVRTVEREQSGDAKTEHERLAARWRVAGHKFDCDPETLTLSRIREVDDWTRETVTHIPA